LSKNKGEIEDFKLAHPQGAKFGQRWRQHLDSAKLQRFKFFLIFV
jgi:hypothetical protein